MNAERRKNIRIALDTLASVRADLENIRDEEQALEAIKEFSPVKMVSTGYGAGGAWFDIQYHTPVNLWKTHV